MRNGYWRESDTVVATRFDPAAARPPAGPAYDPAMAAGWGARLIRLGDRAMVANERAFERPELVHPNHTSRRRGWAHYGVMIPDLAAPHRYFDVMSIVGSPGAEVFDNDHLMRGSPRNTATFVSATAAMGHFEAYSVRDDCELAEDGSLVRFGDHLTLRNGYPDFRVEASYPAVGFTAELAITASPTVTWFTHSAWYDHYSLLCEVEGWVALDGERTPVSTLCTWEYGSSRSIYNVADSPVLARLKLPIDQFTYQIVNLDDRTQLLLGRNLVRRVAMGPFAQVRSLDRPGTRTYEAAMAIDPAAEPLETPDGRRMVVPERVRWEVRDQGRRIGRLEAVVDTPWVYGLGAGFVAGYEIRGELTERAGQGHHTLDGVRGYIEWSDTRPLARQRSRPAAELG